MQPDGSVVGLLDDSRTYIKSLIPLLFVKHRIEMASEIKTEGLDTFSSNKPERSLGYDQR
jgi:hypothetical protein